MPQIVVIWCQSKELTIHSLGYGKVDAKCATCGKFREFNPEGQKMNKTMRFGVFFTYSHISTSMAIISFIVMLGINESHCNRG